MDLCGEKSRFYDVRYLTQTTFIRVTSHNGVDIDHNPVHYGVVYAHEYANNVAQLLSYNIHDTVCNDNEHTTSQTYDNVVTYGVVNDIGRSNNSDMNPNNDNNMKVNTNCHYDDTNNILSFYLPWKQVQIRVLNDDHNDIFVDHYACDNDYDIHVIHDAPRNNNDLIFTDDGDHDNDIVNRHASDGDHDIYVNNNIHIKNNDDIIYDNNNIT